LLRTGAGDLLNACYLAERSPRILCHAQHAVASRFGWDAASHRSLGERVGQASWMKQVCARSSRAIWRDMEPVRAWQVTQQTWPTKSWRSIGFRTACEPLRQLLLSECERSWCLESARMFANTTSGKSASCVVYGSC